MEDDGIRKIWVKKNKSWECMAYRPPYRPEDAIKEGLPFEVWIKTPVLETGEYHDPPAKMPP